MGSALVEPFDVDRGLSFEGEKCSRVEFIALMADRHPEPDSPELRARWGAFVVDRENAEKAKAIIARYPAGRQRSAAMPLLDLAQRQVGAGNADKGWLPLPVMEHAAGAARHAGDPRGRGRDVLHDVQHPAPIGRFHVQVCGTTPCMLRGSDDILAACKAKGFRKGHTTDDGVFTLTEVECMGNCASAPMVQINDDNYEDLTAADMTRILDELAAGRQRRPARRRRAATPSSRLAGRRR